MNTTVIIVAYKSEKIIERNLNELDPNCKVIIIDNSHNEVLKNYLEIKYKNVKVVLNNNKGFSQAANLGVKLANTEYIFFCSPDNFIKSKTVYKLEQIADKYKNFSLFILTGEGSEETEVIRVEKEVGMSSFLSSYQVLMKIFSYITRMLI